jgi:hypothetical protein
MHKHPIDGVGGAKPRIPAGNGAPVTKKQLAELNHSYLEARNRMQSAKASAAEMALQERNGTLVSRRLAKLEISFILNSFRQRVMSEPAQLARALVHAGLLEEAHRHAAQEVTRASLYAMLHDLAAIPNKLEGADLRSQVDGTEPRTPKEAAIRAARAERTRAKELAAQRARRAR